MKYRRAARNAAILLGLVALCAYAWSREGIARDQKEALLRANLVAAAEALVRAQGRVPSAEEYEAEVRRMLGGKAEAPMPQPGFYPSFEALPGGYAITLVRGFDGPYPVYDSRTRRWSPSTP